MINSKKLNQEKIEEGNKMVKKIEIYMLTIMSIMMAAFIISPVAAVDTTPPGSITNLHMNSRGTNYIDWGWTNPTSSDFNHVDVYINGVYKADVPKGTKHYKATGLLPSTTYTIGAQTVDNSANINPISRTNTQTTKAAIASGTIRFMTIGDPHLSSDTSAD